MTLREYRRKRNLRATPELAESEADPGGGAGPYVIWKHAASRRHYDFRLQMDGVLKSWGVPQGPSLDPKEKRLVKRERPMPVERDRKTSSGARRNARARDLERPDRLVFDLDPGPGVAWAQVADAALRIRERLERIDLASDAIVRAAGPDPWSGAGSLRQSVTAARLKKAHAL